ncbi:uncharacterized protein SAPINGB_P006326 [Magnusiomyces paraingens]|uniref:Phosphoglycerate mutase n=1 Tax=Magnusiomyces paraingens TaxID=2606893 RepID=A0A5E8C5J3_9ASCO|nr:uncharacterized protein SAPINGB_P006326 [Saprochaete ingens]VVT58672.1 unnamed protein product [Saprochaete ingens]
MSKAITPAGTTPRVIFFRHGETEWSLSGQYTSITDLNLTPTGVRRVAAVGRALIGPDRLVDLRHVETVFVSPRARARETLDLLLANCDAQPKPLPEVNEVVTEAVREWDYGDYEGLTTPQIIELRIKRGTQTKDDPKWTIWRDGCEGGEKPADVTARLDAFIAQVIEVQQKAVSEGRYGDVVIVAHGHILRSLTMRWLKLRIEGSQPIALILEAGGSGVLSYEHHNWDERALNLGGAFTVPKEVN